MFKWRYKEENVKRKGVGITEQKPLKEKGGALFLRFGDSLAYIMAFLSPFSHIFFGWIAICQLSFD